MRTRQAARRREVLMFGGIYLNSEDKTMMWRDLLKYLFGAIGGGMGPFGRAALALLLRRLGLGSNPLPAVDSPDELKAVVKKYLEDLIAQYAGDGLIAALLSSVLLALSDQVIDMVWDWLVRQGHATQPLAAFGRALPLAAATTESTVDPVDAAAMVELGC